MDQDEDLSDDFETLELIAPQMRDFYKYFPIRDWAKANYVEKLQQGMGIDDKTGAAILKKASELLASDTRINMSNPVNQKRRDDLVPKLLEDPLVGQWFKHPSAEYEILAHQFFEEVPKYWLMCANCRKPKPPASTSNEPESSAPSEKQQ